MSSPPYTTSYPPSHLSTLLSALSSSAYLPWLAPLLAACLWVTRDYRGWLAYGTGGFDPTPKDYALISFVRVRRFLRGDDGRDARVLRRLASGKKRWGVSYLSEDEARGIKRRDGPRPGVRARPLPHRQTSAPAQASTHSLTLAAFFTILAQRNPSILVAETSLLERHGPALSIHPDVKDLPEGDAWTRNWGRGEIAHVHGEEGSLHVTLSPEDAARCIELGWGERMTAAGVAKKVPEGNVMIYSARSEAEVEVVKAFIVAGCRFFTGQEIVH